MKSSRFLIIKPSSLGDILHTLPAVSLIKTSFPKSYIAWIVRQEYADFLREIPYIDEIIPFERTKYSLQKFPFWMADFWKWIGSFRNRFDISMDFQGLFRSGIMSYLARTPKRIGFAHAREGSAIFYTQKITPNTTHHAIIQNATLLKALKIDPSPSSNNFYLPIPIHWKNKTKERFPEFFSSKHLISIIPGARWPSKLWSPKKFSQLICKIRQTYPFAKFMILGGFAEIHLAKKIQENLDFPLSILAGKTNLWELATLLQKSNLVISGDTGPMHMASLLKTPVLALLGPNKSSYIHPWGTTYEIASSNLSCIGCERPICPLKTGQCMKELEVSWVFQKFLEMGKL